MMLCLLCHNNINHQSPIRQLADQSPVYLIRNRVTSELNKKSRLPRNNATARLIATTKTVYTVICLRVGQFTRESSTFASIRNSNTLFINFPLKKSPEGFVESYYQEHCPLSNGKIPTFTVLTALIRKVPFHRRMRDSYQSISRLLLERGRSQFHERYDYGFDEPPQEGLSFQSGLREQHQAFRP